MSATLTVAILAANVSLLVMALNVRFNANKAAESCEDLGKRVESLERGLHEYYRAQRDLQLKLLSVQDQLTIPPLPPLRGPNIAERLAALEVKKP